jgi:hypothetical protein
VVLGKLSMIKTLWAFIGGNRSVPSKAKILEDHLFQKTHQIDRKKNLMPRGDQRKKSQKSAHIELQGTIWCIRCYRPFSFTPAVLTSVDVLRIAEVNDPRPNEYDTYKGCILYFVFFLGLAIIIDVFKSSVTWLYRGFRNIIKNVLGTLFDWQFRGDEMDNVMIVLFLVVFLVGHFWGWQLGDILFGRNNETEDPDEETEFENV